MSDKTEIAAVVESYFRGTYEGDAALLKQIFHPNVRITGSFNGEYCDWSLDEFLARVTAKPTALEKNEKYDKNIVSIDCTNHAAMVKARVGVGNLNFTDYITLLKIQDKWVIRSKSFTT